MSTLREWPKRFGQGIGLPFRAARLLLAHPELRLLMAAPAALTGIGLAFGLTVGWRVSAALLGALWVHPPAGWALPLLWEAVHVLMYVLGVLFDALALPEILGAPLNDRLSAQVEQLTLGGERAEVGVGRLVREVVASMVAAVARLLRFGVIQVLLLLLNLIPGGQAVYPVAAFIWGALWLAQQYFDLTMARHLHRPQQTRALLRRLRPLSLGLGLVLAAVFLLPLANLLLVPLGVASGALLYCDLIQEGLITDRA